MKKTYNSPVMTVVELKMRATLLEASLQLKGGNATSAAMGRANSSWDDEDE